MSMNEDDDLTGLPAEPKPCGWVSPDEYDPEDHCGHQVVMTDRACTNKKGMGTPQPGFGPCHLHGGKTAQAILNARRVLGLYHRIRSPKLKDALARVRDSNVDALDLAPEVDVLRAIVLDFVERRDEFVNGIVAFKRSFDAAITKAINADRTHDPELYQEACAEIASSINQRPVEVVDVSQASKIIDQVGRMSERIHKFKTSDTITLDQIKKLLDNMGIALARHVKDPDTIKAIQADWNQIVI